MRTEDSSFSKKSIADKMDRILDMFPISRSRELLPSKTDSETIEDKWEQLQYYESEQWQRRSPSPRSIEHSSSNASSSSSLNSTSNKFGFFKNLKRLTAVKNPFSSRGAYKQAPTSEHVNMSPNGQPKVHSSASSSRIAESVVPKLRSAKSLQNINNITINGIHSIREATSNLKNKCNSKIELNSQKHNYDMFFNSEEDELENFRKQERVLMGVGLL
ncbi:uncharacterized protein [Lepeophtheirus salmonis]|uniref:Uncharacterized protein n=1 Tax=Lepeophtheirus salmonis TaxID=72036 RepID=A0A0K2T7R9_LEPSM|nr:uncharacterized protein LOC121118032 [Lepeophtheirus salmonis]XP_040568500.1 uncharacterized protein LOC121118032 [Lepeophtheirus salmonis]